MPNGSYTLFQSKGANVGGSLQMPAQVPGEVPSHWVGYVHMADIDTFIDVVQQAGGHVLFPVMDVPNVGRFTQLRDPSGAVVAVMTPARM
jgi:predicted enzyme related to lactoylglutathione lyase